MRPGAMLPSHPTPPRCCPSCRAGALSASDTASLLPSTALSATTLLCLHESNSSGDLTEVDHAAFVSCSLSHLEQYLQGSSQGWPVSERLSFLRLGCHLCVDGPHKDVQPFFCSWTSVLLPSFGCGWFGCSLLRDKCWWEWKVALFRRRQPGGRQTLAPEPPLESLLSREGF